MREEKSKKTNDPLKSQFKNYSPLIEPLFFILVAIERLGLIKFFDKTDKPLGRKKEASCQFHNTYKHSIDKYQELMNQVEILIKERKLRRFMNTKAYIT